MEVFKLCSKSTKVSEEPLADLLPSHQVTWVFQQSGQNLKGLRLQLDLDSVLVQFAGTKVDLKDTETEDAAGSGGNHSDTPTLTDNNKP
jgi:hypothetical protein